jgi:hypothetical protein
VLMRLAATLLTLSTISLWGALANAAVTEPTGLVVTRDSGTGKQLYTLFLERNEAINWTADASDIPETFSPLCDFAATLVLHETSGRAALGWYNVPEAGAPAPGPSEIVEVIQCDTAVGAAITSLSIKNHTSYRGGEIGFALANGRNNCVTFSDAATIDIIHYTEKRFNVKYQDDPSTPWIMSLKYPSTQSRSAYYVAFEDWLVSASGWENDGDFNDFVVFLDGLVCSGGGGPCDTGNIGICGPGVVQCDALGALTCTEIVSATAELCDGADNDCDGAVDEGDLCSGNEVCFNGECVPPCGSGEFDCPAVTHVCDYTSRRCVQAGCAEITCPENEVCVDGVCKGPCDDIRCPPPLECRVGACIDPCAGKVCPEKQVCDRGACRLSCSCAPCSSDTECNEVSGLCVEPGCGGQMTCPPGTRCAAANCVDSCSGAVCPKGQKCEAGACIHDPEGGIGAGGLLLDGGINLGSGGTAPSGAGGSARKTGGEGALCVCRAAGSLGSDGQNPLGPLVASIAVLLWRIRRRQRAAQVS